MNKAISNLYTVIVMQTVQSGALIGPADTHKKWHKPHTWDGAAKSKQGAGAAGRGKKRGGDGGGGKE